MVTPGPRDHQPVGPDPGDEDRDEAIRQLARRAGIWAVPVIGIGILITALGIPFWISLIAMVLAMVILVFEVEI